jgi:hypothetical protein
MTICERFGGWAESLSLDVVPERVRERARLQQASILAAGRAGEAAAAPFAAAAPDGPVGEVYLGAAASIAHDWDDYLYMGHTGHSTVWASRAFAPADEELAALAQVAANEIAGRLGAALLIGPHNGQFWSSIHCGGAAVAAGVALGLDAERIAHALAISLYQPPYGLWPGFMGPPTKLLTAAEPAAQGVRAALLSAEGVDGPLGVIEDRRGLLTSFAFVRRPSMLGALGQTWLTDTLAFKPRPGCAYLQAAVDAALRADVSAAEVASIDVEAGLLTVAMEQLGPPDGRTAAGINFSAARSVAVALIAGRLSHAELAPAWLAEHAAEVAELGARVRVRHDWEASLETLAGAVEAGASAGDVPLAGWLHAGRRARELGILPAALGAGDLRELARRGTLRRELARLLSLRSSAGLDGIETTRMRLSFPCRLRIALRSGRIVEVQGDQPGSCGRPLSEQRAVVHEKCRLLGLDPEPAGARAAVATDLRGD